MWIKFHKPPLHLIYARAHLPSNFIVCPAILSTYIRTWEGKFNFSRLTDIGRGSADFTLKRVLYPLVIFKFFLANQTGSRTPTRTPQRARALSASGCAWEYVT